MAMSKNWESAKQAFINQILIRNKDQKEFEHLHKILDMNRKNRGRISDDIIMMYKMNEWPKRKVHAALYGLIKSNHRHNKTQYDLLLAVGFSRRLARKFIELK